MAKKLGNTIRTSDFACRRYTQIARVQSSTIVRKNLWPTGVLMWKGPQYQCEQDQRDLLTFIVWNKRETFLFGHMTDFAMWGQMR